MISKSVEIRSQAFREIENQFRKDLGQTVSEIYVSHDSVKSDGDGDGDSERPGFEDSDDEHKEPSINKLFGTNYTKENENKIHELNKMQD